ncbi:MAG: hypothetical protein QG671_3086 [Actinomycetota bacterium]|nr:hypothetical protein [Actinomycetota bacterium]HQZ84712.1 CD225/dispanin family protein [Actinomycetota bacterium]
MSSAATSPVLPRSSKPPGSWLVPAVITTLCCFPITGVVAVYWSAQVRTRWELGDEDGARRAARRAKLWVLLGFVIYLVAVAVMIGTGSASTYIDRVRG